MKFQRPKRASVISTIEFPSIIGKVKIGFNALNGLLSFLHLTYLCEAGGGNFVSTP